MERKIEKFSLRALLLLTVLLAVPCCLLSSVRTQYYREVAVAEKLRQIHPSVAATFREDRTLSWLRLAGFPPVLLQRIAILDVTGISSGNVRIDLTLAPVYPVDFGDSELDEMMPHILELQNLWALELNFTNISDKSAGQLAELKTLERLNLNDTKITTRLVRQLEERLPNTTILFGH